MSKHIAVLVTDMVEEIKLKILIEAYKEAGHKVDIISDEASKKIKGKNGDIIEADKGIADVNASDYDALLVPGGFSPDILRINPDNSAFAKEFFIEDKTILSIFHVTQYLVYTNNINENELYS